LGADHAGEKKRQPGYREKLQDGSMSHFASF
jgi:hypothetical protein